MNRSLTVDPPPPVPPSDGPPRRRREPPSGGDNRNWLHFLPHALGIALMIIGLVFGVVAYRMVIDHDSFESGLSKTILIYAPRPESVFGKERIYVMLLGIDFNYDEKGMPYSKGARSDTIMVAGLDFPTRSLKIVSILRDTEAIVNGHDTKINEAYSDGGVKLADQVIGDFIGMPKNPVGGASFDRFVVVNSNGVKDFVDAIGGIDVPVTEKMDYDDSWGHLHIHFKPGLVHMNGYDAMAYSRFRHDACSDPCRTKRQQQIIHITLAKLKGNKLNDLAHIGALIGALNKNIYTNLTFDEEKSLAWSFKDANLADLGHADTIPYVDTKNTFAGGEVLIPDARVKAKLIADLFGAYGNVTPPPLGALAAIKPATVHLVVQNGSGVPGLAGVAAAKLQKLGYVVDTVTNADAFSYDVSEIRPASKIANVGERVRQDLGVPGAPISPATDATPGPKTLVTVIVGKDYAQTAVAAPAVGATPSTAPLH